MAANNWVVRANGGIYKITTYTSATQVTVSVVRVPLVINPYTNNPYNAIGGYTIWTPISTVSGLTQLVGQTVVGVADGVAVGPFVVSATGSVALGVTATKVTLGLAYLPQLQTLPLDLGEPTVQREEEKNRRAYLARSGYARAVSGENLLNAGGHERFHSGECPYDFYRRIGRGRIG